MEMVFTYIVYPAAVLISLAIVAMTFSQLRERSLAIRGCFAAGFLALFFSVFSATRFENPAWPLLAAACAFGIVAAVETWGPRTP